MHLARSSFSIFILCICCTHLFTLRSMYFLFNLSILCIYLLNWKATSITMAGRNDVQSYPALNTLAKTRNHNRHSTYFVKEKRGTSVLQFFSGPLSAECCFLPAFSLFELIFLVFPPFTSLSFLRESYQKRSLT
ncbi:unnamed protein product [Choristocarpus tenellus]